MMVHMQEKKIKGPLMSAKMSKTESMVRSKVKIFQALVNSQNRNI